MAGICLLILVNMFGVGKRYLNADSFTTPRQFGSHFNQRPVDKAILEDPAVSYRVADLSADMFNDTFNSYWHKSIGGYSPAKLQRYQDLIDRYLTKEIMSIGTAVQGAATIEEAQAALPEMKVMSALNTKYLIFGGDMAPVVNEKAYGTAWFVDGFSRRYLEEQFLTLDCGPDVEEIVIAFALLKTIPGHKEQYKPRRPKFTEYGGWKTFGPDGLKDREIKKRFFIDRRIDGDLFNEFIEADEEQAKCFLAREILQSLELLDNLPKRLKQFDKECFKSAVSDYFQRQGWIKG